MTQTPYISAPSTLEAPAEVSQLAASQQLGDLLNTYKQQGVLQIIGTGLGIMILGIALLVGGGWLLDTFHLTGILAIIIVRPAAIVGLGLFFFGPISLIKRLVTRTNEFYQYSRGFIVKTPEKQLETYPWDQIREVQERSIEHKSKGTTIATTHQYTIVRSDGQKIVLSDNIKKVRELVALARSHQKQQ